MNDTQTFLELCAVCEALLTLCKRQEAMLASNGIIEYGAPDDRLPLHEEREAAYTKYQALMGPLERPGEGVSV